MSENEKTDNSKLLELTISEDVIASIAINAAKDVDGVAGFSIKPTNILKVISKTETNKHVSVQFGDNDLKITIYIIVKSGFNIQSVANDVQKAVKSTVQNMTNKIVSKVNVTIGALDSAI